MRNPNWRVNIQNIISPGDNVTLRGELFLRAHFVDHVAGLALLYNPKTQNGPDEDGDGWEKLSDIKKGWKKNG